MMRNNEIWKDVPNYEGLYQASNFGRIKSLPRVVNFGCAYRLTKERFLKGGIVSGYLDVGLCKNGKIKHYYVHRLVWEAFNGAIPSGMDCNHINEIKTDNRLSNLNLMSRKENINWGTHNERSISTRTIRNRQNGRKQVLQFDLNGNLIKEWESSYEIKRQLGYNCKSIWGCCNGKRYYNTAYGYVWRYK